MTNTSNWAREQLEILDQGWDRLMAAIGRLGPAGLERPLTPKWTIKEMLAHLAFWEETYLPVIETIFRGGPELAVDQLVRRRRLRIGARRSVARR